MYSRRRFLKFGLTAAVVVIVAGAGGYFALQQPPAPQTQAPATPVPSPATTPATPTVTVTAPAPTRSPTPTPTPAPPAPVRSFSFTVQDQTSPWAFVIDGDENNPTININVGDTVEITLNNDGQSAHTWTLDADSPSPYDVTTADVFAGESDTITFVADKPGTFSYYCAIPGHRDLGMTGQLIVS